MDGETAGFGSGGAKFAVDFSITGTGERDLERITGAFRGLKTEMADMKLDDHARAAGGLNTQIRGLAGGLAGMNMHAAAAAHLFDRIGRYGKMLVHAGEGIFAAWGEAIGAVISKGSELEQMLIRLQATGKTNAEARQMMADTIEFTTKLPITESQAVRITQTLAIAHVDALKPIGETYAKLAAQQKTLKDLPTILGTARLAKEGPTALSIIGDMLASMGHIGSPYQTIAIQELTQFIETGFARSPKTFGPLLPQIRALGHHAHTAKDRLEGLQKILEDRGAIGVSVASMSTLGGIMTNFKGLLDRIGMAVMEPGKAGGPLSQLTQAFIHLYDVVGKFFNERTPEGQKFLASLRSLMEFVVNYMVKGLEVLGEVLSVVFTWMSNHETLVKMLSVLSAFVAVVFILGGSFLMLVAAIGALMVMWPLMIGAITAGLEGIATAATFVFGYIAAAVQGVISAIAMAFWGLVLDISLALATIGLPEVIIGMVVLATVAVGLWAIFKQFKGVGRFFDDLVKVLGNLKLFVRALDEAFTNWDDHITSISTDTAKELDERGLLGTFMRILTTIQAIIDAWDSFKESMASAGWVGKTILNIGDSQSVEEQEAVGATTFDTTEQRKANEAYYEAHKDRYRKGHVLTAAENKESKDAFDDVMRRYGGQPSLGRDTAPIPGSGVLNQSTEPIPASDITEARRLAQDAAVNQRVTDRITVVHGDIILDGKVLGKAVWDNIKNEQELAGHHHAD